MGTESGKRIKVISFMVLFVAASYFFGYISHTIGEWGNHNFSPTSGSLYLLLWLIVSAGLVAIVAGFVAVLLRPFWLSLATFSHRDFARQHRGWCRTIVFGFPSSPIFDFAFSVSWML